MTKCIGCVLISTRICLLIVRSGVKAKNINNVDKVLKAFFIFFWYTKVMACLKLYKPVFLSFMFAVFNL